MSIDDTRPDTLGGATTAAPDRPVRRTPRPRPASDRPLDRDGRTAVLRERTARPAGRDAAGQDGGTAVRRPDSAARGVQVAPGPVRVPRREEPRPRKAAGSPSRAPARAAGRRRTAPRTPFVLLVLGLLGGGLVTLLLLNTVLARDSFLLSDLRDRNKALNEQRQDREKDLLLKNQPGSLSERALSPTYKPDPGAPEFLDLDGGRSGRPAGLDQTPLGTPPEGEATEVAPR